MLPFYLLKFEKQKDNYATTCRESMSSEISKSLYDNDQSFTVDDKDFTPIITNKNVNIFSNVIDNSN